MGLSPIIQGLQMNSEFAEFEDLVKKSIDRCPWLKKQTLEEYQEKVIEETKEITKSLQNKDFENLKEELGDLFWDVAVMAHLAEKEGHFKAGEIVASVKKKMAGRKPFILGEKKEVSIEDAKRMWNEAKAKERL